MASRGLQETIYWGGYPTVAGFAVGLLSARALFDLARRPSLGTGAVAGLLLASIPLVHGISGAVWVYVCGPLILLAGIGKVRRWRPVGAAAVTAVSFGAYLAFGKTEMDDRAQEWTRAYQSGFAPKEEGIALLQNAFADIVRWGGEESSAAWLAGVGWLLARRRWGEAGLLLVGAALILGVVVNSAFWVLPGSIALYPERAPYLLNALSTLALALAWRSLPLWSRQLRRTWAVLGLLLVAACVPKYLDRYQRTVTLVSVPPERRQAMSFPVVGREEYEALVWCRDHFDPTRDMVNAKYNTAGSYLTPVAGIATDSWHLHCFILPFQEAIFNSRPFTHRFVVLATEGDPVMPGATEVFRNAHVVIHRLP